VNVRPSCLVVVMQHPPPQHFSISDVPLSPMILLISSAFLDINTVLARLCRSSRGSTISASSDVSEKVREGTLERGDELLSVGGSSGMQCDVVATRIGCGGRMGIEVDMIDRRTALRSMYDCKLVVSCRRQGGGMRRIWR